MKNEFLKTSAALLCAVFVCLCFIPAAYAVEPLELHMESVVVLDGGLRIYCNTNSETTPRKDDFNAALGNAALSVTDVTVFEDADAGASYIFLVDVSGSIKQSQLTAIRDTVTSFCAKLTDKDNISIVAIGNETYTQPFVSDPEDIQSQINAIEPKYENTSIYESVFKSLAILNTHEDCHDKKVLVIFSDGEEYSFQGITIDEAAIKIKDSNIPIYTVAMLGTNPAPQYTETAKILGSFARLSAGGRHYIHTLDKAASETIADNISASVGNGLIVSTELSGFSSDGGDMMLRLELAVSGMGTANDGRAISTAGLSAPSPEPEPSSSEEAPTPEPDPAPTPNTPETDDEETAPTKPDYTIWIIGGAVALIAAGIAVFVLKRKKPADLPPPEPLPVTMPITTPLPPVSVSPPQGKPRIALRLTKVGLTEEQAFHAEFAGTLIIGRDASKAMLIFENDELLSSRHCSISYEPEGIVLCDLGSTNGTFVNGVPIQERHILENNDILLIGSMELRVNWENL